MYLSLSCVSVTYDMTMSMLIIVWGLHCTKHHKDEDIMSTNANPGASTIFNDGLEECSILLHYIGYAARQLRAESDKWRLIHL